MNVFRFELRRAWVGAAIWTLVILGLLPFMGRVKICPPAACPCQ